MKKTFIAIVAAVSVLAGCEKKEISSEVGTVAFNLLWSDKYNDRNPVPVKSGETVDINSFIVTIKDASDKVVISKPYSELPSSIPMAPGEYKVTAISPSDGEPVAFDKPVYGDEKSFSVVREKVSNIELECTLYNAKVSINLSSKFVAEVIDYEIVVDTKDGSLVWNDGDMVDSGKDDGSMTSSKSGYFLPTDLLTINVKGFHKVNPDAEPAELTYEVKNVRARDHIIFNLDAKVTGAAEGGLSINADLNEREEDIIVDGFPETPVERPDPEEPENPESAEGPTMEWPDNPSFEPMKIETGMAVNMLIKVPAGIKGFIVRVNSPVLNSLLNGMLDIETENPDAPVDMDFINNEKVIEIMSGFNVPAGEKLTAPEKQPIEFSLSSLVPMIAGLQPEDGSNHIFTLEITDKNDKVFEQDITFFYKEDGKLE